jgi:hypothetical protein
MSTSQPSPSGSASAASRLAPRVGAAVAIAVAVAFAVQFLGSGPQGPRPSTSGVVNPPDPPPADPARWEAAFPLEPLPAPVLTGSDAVTRALNRALEPYRQGDYREAATALDGVLLDHPDQPVAVLYLGISRLMTDETQNALELLRSIPGSASADVMAEAQWYSAVGIARLRDPSTAATEARAICDGNGPASARACAALARLGK